MKLSTSIYLEYRMAIDNKVASVISFRSIYIFYSHYNCNAIQVIIPAILLPVAKWQHGSGGCLALIYENNMYRAYTCPLQLAIATCTCIKVFYQ